jgi:hypothetical protein
VEKSYLLRGLSLVELKETVNNDNREFLGEREATNRVRSMTTSFHVDLIKRKPRS